MIFSEKLCLRWRDPRRATRAVNDFVNQEEDLRNGQHTDVHATRLKQTLAESNIFIQN